MSARVRIGVAREIKTDEYRVALTPAGARELVQKGHDVLVEAGAGDGSAMPDDDYVRAGAEIVSLDDVWAKSELLLKVKEPIAVEYPRLREDLVLFTYLHIAADEPLTRAQLGVRVAELGDQIRHAIELARARKHHVGNGANAVGLEHAQHLFDAVELR